MSNTLLLQIQAACLLSLAGFCCLSLMGCELSSGWLDRLAASAAPAAVGPAEEHQVQACLGCCALPYSMPKKHLLLRALC